MSVQMMGAVIDCGPQDPTQFCVLLMLANNADDHGWAFPSLQTVAANSRCSLRTTMRQIAELEAGGWIFVARKVLNGKSNVYALNVGKIGVTVSPTSRRSPVITRLLKKSGDRMTPIFSDGNQRFSTLISRDVAAPAPPVDKPVEDPFLPQFSGDTDAFSGDNPQPPHVPDQQSQVTNEGGSGDKLWHPNRHNRQGNHQGTVNEVEPTPLPPSGGDVPESFKLIDAPSTTGRERMALLVPDPHHAQAWDRIRIALKTDLSILADRPNFRRIRAAQDDYKTCFEECWLTGILHVAGTWTFAFLANNAGVTELGLAKYRSRLEGMLRVFFPVPKHDTIRLIARPNEDAREPAA